MPLTMSNQKVVEWQGNAGQPYGIFFSFKCWVVDDVKGTILFYTMEARSPGGVWTPLDPTRGGRAGCSSMNDFELANKGNSDISTVWTPSSTGTQKFRVRAWLSFADAGGGVGFMNQVSLVIID